MKFASAKSLNEDARLRVAYKKAAALGAAAKAKKRDALVKKFCEGLKALVLAKRERDAPLRAVYKKAAAHLVKIPFPSPWFSVRGPGPPFTYHILYTYDI